MSNAPYLDGDTIERCHEFLRNDGTLEDLANRLHFQDTELLGRLLQLPASQPAQPANSGDDFDLFACDRLDGLTERELRVELGMPVYESAQRQTLPWELRQRDLFDQPERGEISQR